MKIWMRLAGGVLLLALGVVWGLQGTGVMGRSGSGMSGKGQWFVIGLLVAVAGVVLLVGGARQLRAGRRG
ncbi:MAG: hypothetical protein V7637_5335 [Mycobacteriales bacterium]|jgi:hypothetical protein